MQGEFLDAVVVRPKLLQLADVLVLRVLELLLRRVQVGHRHRAVLKPPLHDVIAFLGDVLRPHRRAALLRLVVELHHAGTHVVGKLDVGLLHLRLGDFHVCLGHPHLSLAHAPVVNGDGHGQPHRLVVFQPAVGGGQLVAGLAQPHPSAELHLQAAAGPGLGQGALRLQQVELLFQRMGGVHVGLVEHVLSVHLDVRHIMGRQQFHVVIIQDAQVGKQFEEPGTQGEARAVHAHLGVQHGQFQLQHLALRRRPQVEPFLGDAQQPLPVLVVGAALPAIFLCRKHVEEQVRHVNGDVLHRLQVVPLGALILQRSRLLPPFQGVISPDGLRVVQNEGHGVIGLLVVAELVEPRKR